MNNVPGGTTLLPSEMTRPGPTTQNGQVAAALDQSDVAL